jgi:hypothetical protein
LGGFLQDLLGVEGFVLDLQIVLSQSEIELPDEFRQNFEVAFGRD